MISFAESMKIQPIDRDYSKHNIKRSVHFEIFGDGFSHCITGLSQHIPYVLLVNTDD